MGRSQPLPKALQYSAFLLMLLISRTSGAAERYEFFTGVRQMGMGGASVAVVNDETALLSNPAGLGKLRTYIITIVDPEITASQDNGPIMGGRPFGDMMQPQILLDTTKLNTDRHWNAKGQVFPSAVINNFGFGVFAKQEYNAETRNSQFQFDYTYDLAAILGYSVRLFDGRIKIGAVGRYMNRAEAHEVVPDTTTNLDLGNIVKEGGAITADAGIIMTGPWVLLPTLAATWRDIGHTTFTLNDGIFYKNGRHPDQVKQTVDVALGFFPIHGNSIRSSITFEYRDVLTYSEETDHMRRTHAGLEVNFYDMLFLRGGMNQRYWTAGFEFAFRYFQLQAATYGEEIGDATSNREDRRIVGKLSFRF